MHYHLTLTQRCNLRCTYCGGSVEPKIMPIDLDYPISTLKEFLEKDNSDVIIAFYGGEPTLNVGNLTQIMDTIPAEAYIVQTNGILLHKIPSRYHSKFHSVLISIDGRPATTNGYRGNMVYSKALQGAKLLRQNGFTGDLIARMTVSHLSNIFDDVIHLINLKNPAFNHIHWQLDVMWDTEFKMHKSKIRAWIENNYNPGITKLVEYWINHVEKTGEILGIAPFMGIMYTLLTETKTDLRCGSGKNFFAVTTDGRITICPILPSHEFVVGNIYHSNPDELVDKITIEKPCTTCDVISICGGRCLYANKTKFWGEEGFNLVCSTVKHLISELDRRLPRMRSVIEKLNIPASDFEYPLIPNGVEVIP